MVPAERSYVEAARILGKGSTVLRRWSDHHQWKFRVDVYDEFNAKIDLDAKERERKVEAEMEAKRTIEIISKAKRIVLHDVNALIHRIEREGETEEMVMSHRDLTKLMDRVTMLERVVKGEPIDTKHIKLEEGPREIVHRVVYPQDNSDAQKNVPVEPSRSPTVGPSRDDSTGGMSPSHTVVFSQPNVPTAVGGSRPQEVRVVALTEEGAKKAASIEDAMHDYQGA